MLAVLIGLGTWQMRRRAWKRALLAEIAVAEAAPGVPLAPGVAPFTHVTITGTLRPDHVLYGAEVRDGPRGQVLGAQLIEVLDAASGPNPGRPVLVDRGWVDTASVPPTPAAPVTVDGFVRPPERAGLLSATDDPAARRFWTLDPTKIAVALGVAVPPFTVVALGPASLPDPARGIPRPPDNHLNYALTWFSFAAILMIIFVLYARKALRR